MRLSKIQAGSLLSGVHFYDIELATARSFSMVLQLLVPLRSAVQGSAAAVAACGACPHLSPYIGFVDLDQRSEMATQPEVMSLPLVSQLGRKEMTTCAHPGLMRRGAAQVHDGGIAFQSAPVIAMGFGGSIRPHNPKVGSSNLPPRHQL